MEGTRLRREKPVITCTKMKMNREDEEEKSRVP